MSYQVSATDLEDIRLNELETVNAVLQNIALILATPKGSVPFYRDFGISNEFLDKPMPVAKIMMIGEVREAIETWEPRAAVKTSALRRIPWSPASSSRLWRWRSWQRDRKAGLVPGFFYIALYKFLDFSGGDFTPFLTGGAKSFQHFGPQVQGKPHIGLPVIRSLAGVFCHLHFLRVCGKIKATRWQAPVAFWLSRLPVPW